MRADSRMIGRDAMLCEQDYKENHPLPGKFAQVDVTPMIV
jgi:hypothetical protein